MNEQGKEAPGNHRRVVMARLLHICRSAFVQLEAEYPKAAQSHYRLRDCLSMALSLFIFKFPSLCQYLTPPDDADQKAVGASHKQRRRQRARGNIQALFELDSMPSDTTFRRRLDEVCTSRFERVFRALFQWVERAQLWSEFHTAQSSVLVALDGTGVFSSSTIHCDHCRITNHRDGRRTYSHQVVTAAIVHPKTSASLPFGAEPIGRADGATKNDCEQEAAKRLLRRLRQRHPTLRLVILADALYATGPMVQLLQELHMEFLLAVKPRQHQRGIYTYDARGGLQESRWRPATPHEAAQERLPRDRQTLEYRCLSKRPLNGQHPQLQMTVLQCQRQTKQGGRKVVGEWVTTLPVTLKNSALFVRYARRRWLIENCIFKTMKAQTGMNFEHNYGHGKHALCDNLAQLMMVAALLDQLCFLRCPYFQAVRGGYSAWSAMWECQRVCLSLFMITDWLGFYQTILGGLDPPETAT